VPTSRITRVERVRHNTKLLPKRFSYRTVFYSVHVSHKIALDFLSFSVLFFRTQPKPGISRIVGQFDC
jgi:hypothetical protein